MSAMASQITSLAFVSSTVHSGANQRKHQSSASLAFVRGIHRWPVNSPHKGPVTRKMIPFDDVIMLVEDNDLSVPHSQYHCCWWPETRRVSWLGIWHIPVSAPEWLFSIWYAFGKSNVYITDPNGADIARCIIRNILLIWKRFVTYNLLCVSYGSLTFFQVDIWNVKCARATAFIFH